MRRHNTHTSPVPNRDPGTVDYVPDGQGRDSYIIRNYGLKANYRSSYKAYERSLRCNTEGTPNMDAEQIRRRDPTGKDSSQYLNWPSTRAKM